MQNARHVFDRVYRVHVIRTRGGETVDMSAKDLWGYAAHSSRAITQYVWHLLRNYFRARSKSLFMSRVFYVTRMS